MNVGVLQKHLSDLAGLLGEAGGKAVATDVAACAAALGPFAGLTVKDFAAFLKRAEEYQQTGPAPTPAAAKRPAARGVAPAGLSLAEVVERLGALSDAIHDSKLTADHIDAELKLLDGLKRRDDVKGVADRVKVGPFKANDSIATMASTIKSALLKRRGMDFRTGY